jgi:hypothetical protein
LRKRNSEQSLIAGLGTISLGSIIFFVGTGEKGFKTQELRLIGPSLAGLLFTLADNSNFTNFKLF